MSAPATLAIGRSPINGPICGARDPPTDDASAGGFEGGMPGPAGSAIIQAFRRPEKGRHSGTSPRLSVPQDQGSLLPLVHRALRQEVIGVE